MSRGFLALAFGSDLRIGTKPKGIRRFSKPIRVYVAGGGSVTRVEAYRSILGEFAEKVPALDLTIVEDAAEANIVVRLIDEKDFVSAIEAAFGRKTARAFIARTNPQCMTSLKSQAGGNVVRADTLIIVDKGERVFRDCAYHETLHAFGLSNHDNRNPWTTLNQTRTVGYLTVYDRALLALLYDPRIQPGMTKQEAGRLLPGLLKDFELEK